MKQFEIAVTGMGIISCLGNTLDIVSSSLQAGTSGIHVDEERKELGFKSPLTGMIKDFDATTYLKKKARKTMDDVVLHSYVAALNAILDAGLTPDDFNNYESGIIFGNDSCSSPNVISADILRAEKETYKMGSGYIFQNMTTIKFS